MKRQEVLELIEKLKKTDGIEMNTPYEGTGWDVYFSISGWYNGNYFSFYIRRLKHNEETVYELASPTDKRRPIKQLLKKLTNQTFTQ